MRWLFIMMITLQANAGWRTNGTIPAMVNVTPDVKTEDLSAYLHAFYTLSDGTPHVILGFNGLYAQAWDVNLSNSVSRVFSMTNDPPGLSGQPLIPVVVTYSNTVLVQASANYFGGMWEFDPVALTSTRICTNTDKQCVSICRATDGVIFMGTFGTARVDAWNPANRAFWSYGFADTNLAGVGNYAYYITANSSYVYCVVRGGTPDWYLSIIDRSTTNKTLVWNDLTTTSLTLSEGLDGKSYAQVTTNGVVGYFILTNGTPVALSSAAFQAIPKYDAYYDEPGVDRDMDNWDTQTGWQFDIDATAYSVQGSIPTASMRWKRTNDMTWLSVTETNNWLPVDASFDLIQPRLGTSELLWLTHGYGPVGSFTPGGTASVLGPYKAQSSRDLLQVSTSEAYIAGYHLNTLRWNPSSSWTLTPSTADFAASTNNPYRNDETGGKYHSMLVRGSDGRIFNASRWGRNGVGGSLGWYNPTTGALGTERNSFTNEWDSPTDLKGAINNSKIVWSSWGSNIFVFDATTFTKDTNFTLMNNSSIQKIVEYQIGKMFGISGSNTLGFTTTGTLLYSNNLPAAPYNITPETTDYERITLGPDGYVWQTAGGYLYRINPMDGTYVQVKQTTNNYKVTFTGDGSAYLYGGATVWKLSNLLQQTSELNTGTLIKR